MRAPTLSAAAIALIVALFPATAHADFEVIAGWDQQLFPSYILSTATARFPKEEKDEHLLGDRRGLLGVKLASPTTKARVKVTVSSDSFIDDSTWQGTLANEGETYTILPKIKYRYEQLSEVDQARPVTITFRVEVVGESDEEQSAVVTVRSVNDCPLAYSDGENTFDVSYTFAAFTNEQHPFVDKLLREALDLGTVDKFTGYQESPAEVIRQVYSIWDTLAARDLRYSSITATAADSDLVSSQHVRLLDQALNNKQANCVDGSVLFASVLRKIGIHSFLVLVPGHCYVGFYLDQSDETPMFLETTLLGTQAPEDLEIPDVLDEAVAEDLRTDASWATFVMAVCLGAANFEEKKEQFADENDREHQTIDIAAARKMGILPIGYRGKEEFEKLELDWSAAEEETTAEESESTETEETVETDESEAEEETVEATDEEESDGETE
jgi:hypothetical protein